MREDPEKLNLLIPRRKAVDLTTDLIIFVKSLMREM